MKNAKFVQHAKLHPARYYRNPSDIIRDRRLTPDDRLEILDAWERKERETEGTESEQLRQVRRLRAELERSSERADGPASTMASHDGRP